MVILIWIMNKFAYYLEYAFGKIVRTNTLYLHPRLHFILDSDEENFCGFLEYIYFEFEIFFIKFYYQISSEVRFYHKIDFRILLLNYPQDFNIKFTLEFLNIESTSTYQRNSFTILSSNLILGSSGKFIENYIEQR